MSFKNITILSFLNIFHLINCTELNNTKTSDALFSKYYDNINALRWIVLILLILITFITTLYCKTCITMRKIKNKKVDDGEEIDIENIVDNEVDNNTVSVNTDEINVGSIQIANNTLNDIQDLTIENQLKNQDS